MPVSKGPLNYTTTVEPMSSAQECIGLLVKHGASALGLQMESGMPVGLTFQVETVHGTRQYSLPVNVEGTYKALCNAARLRNIPPRYADRAQAARVGWRVLKDWLAAQLALIEAGVAEMQEVMLPYMHISKGTTVYQAFLKDEQRLMIGAGK